MSNGYRLVDTVVCVKCGQTWYEPSKGKSSRFFKAVCNGGCDAEKVRQSLAEQEKVSSGHAGKK